MIHKPERKGYRLTYYDQLLYDDWCNLGGCSNRLGWAPCSSCTHEGHPISLEEDDDAWELEEGEEEMSRSDIVDKSKRKIKVGDKVRRINCVCDYGYGIVDVGTIWKVEGLKGEEIKLSGLPYWFVSCNFELVEDSNEPQPKQSEWFGYKYKVNPETSKLLQEAVFKDGGYWSGWRGQDVSCLHGEFLFVYPDGKITWTELEDEFIKHPLPEKQPPSKTEPEITQPPKKEFKVGKWYKCIDSMGIDKLIEGNYYLITRIGKDVRDWVVVDGDDFEFNADRFDIDSESDFNLNVTAKLTVSELKLPSIPEVVTIDASKIVLSEYVRGVGWREVNSTNQFSTTNEVNNMSNVNTQRKTVTVNLIDRDAALDEKFSLVACFGEFTTSKSNEALIRSIIIDPENNVAGIIEEHNSIRTKQTNKEILNRTGNKVTLEPVEESDLYWEIR